jgi:hypothetical protein
LRALNFTDDQGALFDSERHRYSFENQGVAAKFAALNADRTWNPAAPRARLADKARWALLFGMILLGLYLILKDLFR